MMKWLRNFWEDESGASAIEYGLIAALISVAAIAALTTMGSDLQNMFGADSNSMQEVPGAVGSAAE